MMTTSCQTDSSLDRFLTQQPWQITAEPFRHLVVRDVFTDECYSRLAAAFRSTLESVLHRGYLKDHDIHGTTLGPEHAEMFAPLLSRAWHDRLGSALGVPATGHVLAGIHHHLAGSSGGFPHNDLNSGWFIGDPSLAEVTFSSPLRLDYTSGHVLSQDVHADDVVHTVRAVAMIFYLCNPGWRPGDGGTTALYRSAEDGVDCPVSEVPPVNNSLLAFECTPGSFHGFRRNTAAERNSIVLWLHRPLEDVISRWGRDAIVPYGLRPGRG
jgi:hypothetical protein